MRKNLKILRIRHDLTQEQMSERIGCTRATYAAIEHGDRAGRRAFWSDLQTAFSIPDGQMWAMMKND